VVASSNVGTILSHVGWAVVLPTVGLVMVMVALLALWRRRSRRGIGRAIVDIAAGRTDNVIRDVHAPTVQARRIDHVVFQHPPSPSKVSRRMIGLLPLRAAGYQERPAIAGVTGVVTSGVTAVRIGEGSPVLHGLGGVGKTQIAAEYARSAWTAGEVDVLVWVEAMSREAIVSSYAAAAAELTGFHDARSDQAARRLLGWLAETDERWLVVLDDLQRPDDLRGLWPPQVSSGQTVVTTRRRDAALQGDGRKMVEVGLFRPAEAEALFEHWLGGRPEQLEGAAELAGALEYLPLAVAQAAAYIADHRTLSCATYRARLMDRRTTLSQLLPDPSGLPDDYRATVAAAWELSVELAGQLPPVGVARPLLELVAVLDPNGIPDQVLTSDATVAYLAAATGREIDESTVMQALSCLHRLSLIAHDPDNPHQAVRVHALVQRAIYETFTGEKWATVAATAADALLRTWPVVNRDLSTVAVFRSNTDSLCTTAGRHLWHRRVHPVLFLAGRSLGDSGQVAAAFEYFDHVTQVTKSELGEEHPDTFISRDHVARWQGEVGDAAGARTAYEGLLVDRLRVLGADHPDTLTTRNHLARWQGEAGDPAGAAAAFRSLLADRLRILGPDHPNTLTTRYNLARWIGQAGDAVSAMVTFQDLLADRLRVLGPDHPHTLATRNNISRWRGEAGDSVGAATAYEQLLADYLRVLGPDHPHTLTTRYRAARWRGEAGDLAGAASAFQRLLIDQIRVLGPDHVETLSSRGYLAQWQGELGDPAGAVGSYENVLSDCLRVLGSEHPQTLATRSGLNRWRGEAGDPVGAATAYEHLLVDAYRVLGPHHPYTLRTYEGLVRWGAEAGDMTSAEANEP